MASDEEETNLLQNKENPCHDCNICCNYVAIELDKPEDEDDWNHIRWYLVHKDVWVFVDHDNSWNIQFNTPCEKLDEKGWCTIYHTRPKICKQYKSDNCEKYGEGESFKLLFKNLEEFDEWYNNGKVIPEDEDESEED